jgi:hypothetical protein
MGMTVIDPSDGKSYDLTSDGDRWTIRETGTGRTPRDLPINGPWKTREQALAALRQMCSHDEPGTNRVRNGF